MDVVITPGDPDGIGPEVTAKALYQLKSTLKKHRIYIVGSKEPFKPFLLKIKHCKPTFIEPPSRSRPGYQSGWSIQTATEFVLTEPTKKVLITGPISKERLQEGGYFFTGHTDFLASLTETRQVTMMLANEFFRVALVTNHCSLNQVSEKITPKNLETTFLHGYQFAKNMLKKSNPKIAFLGLNPHSGENGILGQEEKKVIIPTIQKLQKKFKDTKITGPHPADSFFAVEHKKNKKLRHDVIIAMYHDQGLIPVKLSNFSESLNMTLGLPMIRTSVDHGTAFDIANKNKADPSSMIYAIKKAIEYSKSRRTK